MRKKGKKGVVDTLKMIGALRKRVREARTTGAPIHVNEALEYIIIDNALELLLGTIQSQQALEQTPKE
jgi:hypothetical protein